MQEIKGHDLWYKPGTGLRVQENTHALSVVQE